MKDITLYTTNFKTIFTDCIQLIWNVHDKENIVYTFSCYILLHYNLLVPVYTSFPL